MTPSDATVLARLARAACPQQHFDEYTPDMWFDLLEDLDFEECKDALTEAVKRKPFVAPAEIRAEVKRVRAKRLANADRMLPAADPDAPNYRQRLQTQVKALADGRTVGLALTPGARTTSGPTAEYTRARGAEYARRRAALSVSCPVQGCGAGQGSACRVVGSRRPVRGGFHRPRLEEALRALSDTADLEGGFEDADTAAPAEEAPVPVQVPRVPWCGQCNQETRSRAALTPDGGLRRVPCPTCGAAAEGAAS